MVLGCREEPFHLNFADLRTPGCSASVQREKGAQANGVLGSGASVWGWQLDIRHQRNKQSLSWMI